MADSFLRLELDTLGIKATVVEQTYKQNVIKDDCYILLEDLADAEENNADLFDAGMDRVAQTLDLKICSSAIIFVSSHWVSFRHIDLPFSSEKKIKQVLSFELESLLPVINETYISDFHMLDISNESNLILSASLAESQIEKWFLKLGSLGIKPRIVAPRGYATAVGFLNERSDISTFAFLCMTELEIDLVLVNNRRPCAVRTFPVSQTTPEDLAKSVEQTIIGFNQRAGTDISFDIFVGADEDNSKLEPVFNALEKTLDCESKLRHINRGIQQRLTGEKISSGALLLNISPDKPLKYQFNFCKEKYGTSSFLERYGSNIAVAAVLFLCVLSLMLITIGVENSKMKKKIAAIDSQALSIFKTTFPDTIKIQDPYLQMKANVQQLIQQSGTAGGDRSAIKNETVKVVDIISEVSQKIIPSVDMEILRLLYNDRRLILSGSTDKFNTVDNIKSKLGSSDLFKKVSISSAAADKKGDRVNFKFIIEM